MKALAFGAPLAVIAVLVSALSGCSAAAPTNDDRVHVVASTNVYGDIAGMIGGDLVDVTSIISNPAQDPHSYQGSARTQLALSKADIVIENGGGYDDWVYSLLAGIGGDKVLINATALSGYPRATHFNEHLWYDFPTMRAVADRVALRLSEANPAGKTTFHANAHRFDRALRALENREHALAAANRGRGAAITESVPNYVLEACGLTIVTPPEFSQAIEEGTDVPPLALQHTLDLFAAGTADVLVYNAQTSGPQTLAVIRAAKKAHVPVIAVTETLPAGRDYLEWMDATLSGLERALT
ncbi:MAG: ABC transporter substrate-binding protein [Salinibacterium sp.]|nr:MAG: ABC transporter substrate-binding protein [Salinibacterium sp.]